MVFALGTGSPAVAENLDGVLAVWLEQLKACTAAPAPRLAVIGLDRADTTLAPEEAEQLRLAVESALVKANISLTSSADVTRIKALREGTTGLSGNEVEDQIRAAFDGDAALFIVGPQRDASSVSFRLQAITPKADCKSTSDVVTLDVAGNGSLADPGQVMRAAVRRLIEAAPDLRSIAVAPFASEAGHSECSTALADQLLVALDEEARSPTRALNGKTLTIHRGVPSGDSAGMALATGRFDLDRQNRGFISLDFSRDGRTLAPLPRTPIAIDRLACDPTIRPFLDHVAATAHTDRARLDISAPVFTLGQRLDIAITTAKPLALYCWILAPDETAYVLLPTASSAMVTSKAGSLRYPRDFGLADVVLGQRFENLFACFGSAQALPPTVSAPWLAGAKSGSLIEGEKVEDMLTQMRAVPGIVEATGRVVAR
jgi:hypothetical protein